MKVAKIYQNMMVDTDRGTYTIVGEYSQDIGIRYFNDDKCDWEEETLLTKREVARDLKADMVEFKMSFSDFRELFTMAWWDVGDYIDSLTDVEKGILDLAKNDAKNVTKMFCWYRKFCLA